MTVPSLAVGWVLAQQGVTGAIVGARRPAHVDGWSAAGRAIWAKGFCDRSTS